MAKRSKKEPGQLGALEARVMNAVWDAERASVQDVLRALEPEKELAYTTIMTVLSRLTEKGFLAREKDGRAYVYRPLVSRESMADSALRTVIERFFEGVEEKAVAHLLGRGESISQDELEALEAALRKKRRRKSS